MTTSTTVIIKCPHSSSPAAVFEQRKKRRRRRRIEGGGLVVVESSSFSPCVSSNNKFTSARTAAFLPAVAVLTLLLQLLLPPIGLCEAFVSKKQQQQLMVISHYWGGSGSSRIVAPSGSGSDSTDGSSSSSTTTFTSRRRSHHRLAARERSTPGDWNRSKRNNGSKGAAGGFGRSSSSGMSSNGRGGVPSGRRRATRSGSGNSRNSTVSVSTGRRQQRHQPEEEGDNPQQQPTAREMEMERRLRQLEQLVSSQAVEMRKLKDQVQDLTRTAEAFAGVIELLRQAGLQSDEESESDGNVDSEETELNDDSLLKGTSTIDSTADNNISKNNNIAEPSFPDEEDAILGAAAGDSGSTTTGPADKKPSSFIYNDFDTGEIFGEAPSSVIDAADAAGASILAGMLGGKQRMLIDVRDSELSTNPETLVQFIELAILPVAAGLEGLKSKRNRLKVVFPTVSQLLQYRRTMALSAPEVVALSTLGFDPVEQDDAMMLIVAPAPDDVEGLVAMNELLHPSISEDENDDLPSSRSRSIGQPVVVLNHHMVPISGPVASYEIAYHLRLLSVQYVAGNDIPENLQQQLEDGRRSLLDSNHTTSTEGSASDDGDGEEEEHEEVDRDAAVEAAMKHAQESGLSHGVTRAMVVRAYPKPWHVFVDTSPDTDADFEVAATFDSPPTPEEVNFAIVECLEGSEQEDELVARQMQQALEEGQLDRVTDILSEIGIEDLDDDNDDDDDDDLEDDWDIFQEDSV